MAAAIFQMCCRLGNAVGLAVSNLIRNAVETSARRHGQSATDAALEGLHMAFWTLAGLSLFCISCQKAGRSSAALTPAAAVVGFGMHGWEYLYYEPADETVDGHEGNQGDAVDRA